MAVRQVGTFRSPADNVSVRLTVGVNEITVTQAQLLVYRFFGALRAELKAQARLSGSDFGNIQAHINRDKSIAIAVGETITDWPEGLVMVRTVDEINITNWVETPASVRIPQYQFDLEIRWTDNSGTPQVHTGTYRYPNDISDMPLSVRRRYAEEMIIATARVTLGIDVWTDYE